MLRTLVARAYGAEQVPDGDDFAHEITEGWFNVAYRIALRDGRQVVLKIAPPADVTVLTREIGMMRAELEAIYQDEKGLRPGDDVIAYCRIGERSSHTWFVLSQLLGQQDVKNYDGSWVEYGSLVGVPIEVPAAV